MKTATALKYIQFTEILIYPTNSNIKGENPNSTIMNLMNARLEEGYEIYKAIPFSTGIAAGIKYILRKEENFYESE